jgi:hypothetical protein
MTFIVSESGHAERTCNGLNERGTIWRAAVWGLGFEVWGLGAQSRHRHSSVFCLLPFVFSLLDSSIEP